MENFKYSLDKSSKKYICPNCEQKTFVLYRDNETHNFLADNYGKCDRQQNCNYHKAPQKGKKYFLIPFLKIDSISEKAYKLIDNLGMIHFIPKSQIIEILNDSCWISEWYLKDSKINYLTNEYKFKNSGIELTNKLIIEVKESRINEPDFHSTETMKIIVDTYNSSSIIDNLTSYLLTLFTKDEVQKACDYYYLMGTNYFWSNSTVFWQIDDNFKIHAGKIMLYSSTDGHRIKNPYNHINWLHKALKKDEFKLNQCLFGLHLINEDYQKTIAIVESEKTAIIMSIILPEYIWIATGSKQNLKVELLAPIKKREIVLFPDKGEYLHWLNKANELKMVGYKIAVSELIEQTEYENGTDLIDYYSINNIKKYT